MEIETNNPFAQGVAHASGRKPGTYKEEAAKRYPNSEAKQSAFWEGTQWYHWHQNRDCIIALEEDKGREWVLSGGRDVRAEAAARYGETGPDREYAWAFVRGAYTALNELNAWGDYPDKVSEQFHEAAIRSALRLLGDWIEDGRIHEDILESTRDLTWALQACVEPAAMTDEGKAGVARFLRSLDQEED